MVDIVDRKFPVKEIFYSIQGEGYWVGTPALFIRLAGCNLRCPWCDTDWEGPTYMTAKNFLATIESAMDDYWYRCKDIVVGNEIMVVVTGGEPTLHDLHALVYFLSFLNPKGCVKRVAIETNGRYQIDPSRQKINLIGGETVWWTVSPKLGVEKEQVLRDWFSDPFWSGDELKVVYDADNMALLEEYEPQLRQRFKHFYIQPRSEDFAPAVEYVQRRPGWRLSVQMHKVIGVR